MLFVCTVPHFLKILPIDKLFLFNSHVLFKHVRISPQLEVLLNFSHLPFEFSFVKIFNILFYQLSENFTDNLETPLMFYKVKLEGTVRNSAIVNCTDYLEVLPVFTKANITHDKFIYTLLDIQRI